MSIPLDYRIPLRPLSACGEVRFIYVVYLYELGALHIRQVVYLVKDAVYPPPNSSHRIQL